MINGVVVALGKSRTDRSYPQMLLLLLGAMILLSMSPVFGHHIAESLDAQMIGSDHFGALCLIALHSLLQPVHVGFHLLLVGGLLYACWDRWRAWRSVREALGPLESHGATSSDAFLTAAMHAGVTPSRVRIIHGLPVPAFTAGWLHPNIYVAADLSHRLTAEQLRVVLRHEAVHLQRRDPLRLSLLRFFGALLFWIPALRAIADDWADEAEVTADDAAAAGRPLVLASALVALASAPSAPGGAVGLTSGASLNRRVRRLLGEACPRRSHVTWRSVVFASAALLLVWSSGAVMAHPMPAAASHESSHHCRHDGESAASHLFCFRHVPSAATCPHTISHR